MGNSIYKIIEVVGTSTVSWEDAAKNVVETSAKNLKDLRVAEIVKLDMTVDEGMVTNYRARVNISFKFHGEE
jgi:flavin-binding protein dodecin